MTWAVIVLGVGKANLTIHSRLNHLTAVLIAASIVAAVPNTQSQYFVTYHFNTALLYCLN